MKTPTPTEKQKYKKFIKEKSKTITKHPSPTVTMKRITKKFRKSLQRGGGGGELVAEFLKFTENSFYPSQQAIPQLLNGSKAAQKLFNTSIKNKLIKAVKKFGQHLKELKQKYLNAINYDTAHVIPYVNDLYAYIVKEQLPKIKYVIEYYLVNSKKGYELILEQKKMKHDHKFAMIQFGPGDIYKHPSLRDLTKGRPNEKDLEEIRKKHINLYRKELEDFFILFEGISKVQQIEEKMKHQSSDEPSGAAAGGGGSSSVPAEKPKKEFSEYLEYKSGGKSRKQYEQELDLRLEEQKIDQLEDKKRKKVIHMKDVDLDQLEEIPDQDFL
jgi:hypothetical protein